MLTSDDLSSAQRAEGPPRRPCALRRERGGYQYGRTASGRAYELPGLWFNAEEPQALVILQRVAATLIAEIRNASVGAPTGRQ